MIENNELEKILNKLENLEDEDLAVVLLKDFNNASAQLGKLLLNLDKNLSHEEWKILCEIAQKKLDEIVQKIEQS